MKKTDLLLGLFIGFTAAFIGIFIYLTLYMKLGFVEGIKDISNKGLLGKVVTLGAILNLLIFFVLLKLNKELMARGVVLSLIILAAITIFL
jgi:hypothetical protein